MSQELKRAVVPALKVAVSVGTVLLIINQYGALFGSAELRVIPALLTYCVPFCVFMLGQHSKFKVNEKEEES